VRHVDGGDVDLLLDVADLYAQLDTHLARGSTTAVMSSRRGLITMARASPMRCCWPPDMAAGRRSAMLSSRTRPALALRGS